MKEKFIKLCRKHKFLLVAICWTPAWAYIACIIGKGDVEFILINLGMCWLGFCVSALGTHIVHKFEEKNNEKSKK